MEKDFRSGFVAIIGKPNVVATYIGKLKFDANGDFTDRAAIKDLVEYAKN